MNRQHLSEMPDLLKNNLSEGSVLSLVKSMTDIEDMEEVKRCLWWSKVANEEKVITDWKYQSTMENKGPRKPVDALSKIVNMMRDLYQLAEQHNIKSHLYSGYGLERIYQMMGDSQVTRWLSTICQVEYNDEQTWHHLIGFLEHDLKVQQQKLLI